MLFIDGTYLSVEKKGKILYLIKIKMYECAREEK